MYAQRMAASSIEERIVREVNAQRFQEITDSTLEGLAKRELNLGALIGKSAEAKERRLVPEVIQDFFVAAAPIAGIQPKEVRGQTHVYRIGKLPRALITLGEELERRFGRLGRTYQQAVFDKALLTDDPTLEWVTPGHPLFEVVRADVQERVAEDLERGAVFFDLHTEVPYRVDVFGASVKDGRGSALHRKLFAVRVDPDAGLTIRQPTLFLDLIPAPRDTAVPTIGGLPDRQHVEERLVRAALDPFLAAVTAERSKENEVVRRHMEISLGELIHRQNLQLADLVSKQAEGETTPGLAGNIALAEQHLDELNRRLELRREQLEMERHCTIGDIAPMGSAWVLPHPERHAPGIAPMVQDDEIERIAVEVSMRYERERGWDVKSVEDENRGFDLISRLLPSVDERTPADIRFIEVKGRSAVGEVALSANEYRTAQRLGPDYWLYVVFNCATTPQLHVIRDPARLGWRPVVMVEHYHLGAKEILGGAIE